MAARSASLVQADYDRGVAALVKAGITPSIVYDIAHGTVTIGPSLPGQLTRSDWKKKAPDRA